jgi:hypothetical protein
MGGVWVWDFTDSTRPEIIGFFERGPHADGGGGGEWSAYWYNGHIFASDLVDGFDVLEINDRRVNRARGVKFRELNVQTQGQFRE